MEETEIILNLLMENKIDKQEAMALLDAINKNQRQFDNNGKNFEKAFKKVGKSLDGLTNKASKTYKEYEPTINEKADFVKDKTYSIYKNISKKFGDNFSKDADIFEYDDFENDDIKF